MLGANDAGPLGDKSTMTRPIAVDVSGLSSGVMAISAGDSHTCALMLGGAVVCWGSDTFGQIGDRSVPIPRLTPVPVSGLNAGVTAVSAGHAHTCALVAGGAIKCWGENIFGQLGDNTISMSATPADVIGLGSGVVAIAARISHSCAITVGGAVRCWGYNVHGELGDGSTVQELTPVDVSGLTSGVVAIANGANHTCALTISGGVKCWGYNIFRQLGPGSAANETAPIDVPGLTSDVAAIAAGWNHTCALTTGGAVQCWGQGTYGQLGNNTDNCRTSRASGRKWPFERRDRYYGKPVSYLRADNWWWSEVLGRQCLRATRR